MPSKFISRREYLEKENFKGCFLTVAPLFHHLFTSLAPRSAPQNERFEPFWTLSISRSPALIVPALGTLKSFWEENVNNDRLMDVFGYTHKKTHKKNVLLVFQVRFKSEQQRRRRWRKLKSEFTLFRNSSLVHVVQFVKC